MRYLILHSKTLLPILVLTVLFCCSCQKNPTVLQRYSFVADVQESVFTQTKEKLTIDYDSLAVGIFVKSINGVAQSRTSFWLYYINGRAAQKSADAIIPMMGDTIEWRLVSGY